MWHMVRMRWWTGAISQWIGDMSVVLRVNPLSVPALWHIHLKLPAIWTVDRHVREFVCLTVHSRTTAFRANARLGIVSVMLQTWRGSHESHTHLIAWSSTLPSYDRRVESPPRIRNPGGNGTRCGSTAELW